MTDVNRLLKSVQRPRLLVEAARHGVSSYRRERHLRRLLDLPVLPGPRQASLQLLCLEQAHDAARAAGAAGYSVARHLEVLIALMAEARDALADTQEAAAEAPFLRLV